MKKYRVIINEFLEREREIDANSKEEALSMVKKEYDDEKICLDYSDLVITDFNVVEVNE